MWGVITITIGVGEEGKEGKPRDKSGYGVPIDCGKLRIGGEISWVRNHVKHRVDMMRQDVQVGTQEACWWIRRQGLVVLR